MHQSVNLLSEHLLYEYCSQWSLWQKLFKTYGFYLCNGIRWIERFLWKCCDKPVVNIRLYFHLCNGIRWIERFLWKCCDKPVVNIRLYFHLCNGIRWIERFLWKCCDKPVVNIRLLCFTECNLGVRCGRHCAIKWVGRKPLRNWLN